MKSTKGVSLAAGWLLLAAPALAFSAQPLLSDNFNPGVEEVGSLAIQPDGKILVLGSFATVGGHSRTNLVRLNPDGSVDSQFEPSAAAPGWLWASRWEGARSLALQADGKILLAGGLSMLDGNARTSTNLVRLHADGTLDPAFSPNVGIGFVSSLAIQADGKILAALNPGDYTVASLRRFSSDGIPDAGFTPQHGIYAIGPVAIQADGKILMDRGAASHFGQKQLFRLEPDGSLDRGFDIGGRSDQLLVQADGKILIVGLFTAIVSQARTNAARLLGDGTLDAGFNLTPGVRIGLVALQTNGKILVNASLESPGRQPRSGLARLNADGSLDESFPLIDDMGGLALQADGKILVSTVQGLQRLNNTEPATQTLSYNGSTATWLRGGASPEVWRTEFERSSDGVTWTSLGAGERVPGGWQLTEVSVAAGVTIRARGFVAGNGTSLGIVESMIQAAKGPPSILAGDGAVGIRSDGFGFYLAGTAGLSAIVETSTNLLQWFPLQTNILGELPLRVSDPDGRTHAHRFYRVRTQ